MPTPQEIIEKFIAENGFSDPDKAEQCFLEIARQTTPAPAMWCWMALQLTQEAQKNAFQVLNDKCPQDTASLKDLSSLRSLVLGC